MSQSNWTLMKIGLNSVCQPHWTLNAETISIFAYCSICICVSIVSISWFAEFFVSITLLFLLFQVWIQWNQRIRNNIKRTNPFFNPRLFHVIIFQSILCVLNVLKWIWIQCAFRYQTYLGLLFSLIDNFSFPFPNIFSLPTWFKFVLFICSINSIDSIHTETCEARFSWLLPVFIEN